MAGQRSEAADGDLSVGIHHQREDGLGANGGPYQPLTTAEIENGRRRATEFLNKRLVDRISAGTSQQQGGARLKDRISGREQGNSTRGQDHRVPQGSGPESRVGLNPGTAGTLYAGSGQAGGSELPRVPSTGSSREPEFGDKRSIRIATSPPRAETPESPVNSPEQDTIVWIAELLPGTSWEDVDKAVTTIERGAGATGPPGILALFGTRAKLRYESREDAERLRNYADGMLGDGRRLSVWIEEEEDAEDVDDMDEDSPTESNTPDGPTTSDLARVSTSCFREPGSPGLPDRIDQVIAQVCTTSAPAVVHRAASFDDLRGQRHDWSNGPPPRPRDLTLEERITRVTGMEV